jgi:dynein heavy chain
MKIMRMFNEVSSRQQEMEVKFELMKRTLNLLKKFNRFDVIDLEAKFNNTPIRWSNLKSKVNLAKQRLGPTIQEESKAISQDLKSFAKLINEMRTTILDSDLFDHSCDYEKATKFLDYYDEKFSSLQNQADDLKQLQELLESNIVNFDHLSKTKVTLIYSRQLWKVIK